MKNDKTLKDLPKKCRYCQKSTGKIKYFILGDDMENPKPYHEKCLKKFWEEIMIRFAGEKTLQDEDIDN